MTKLNTSGTFQHPDCSCSLDGKLAMVPELLLPIECLFALAGLSVSAPSKDMTDDGDIVDVGEEVEVGASVAELGDIVYVCAAVSPAVGFMVGIVVVVDFVVVARVGEDVVVG
jgi:hypothetical protein